MESITKLSQRDYSSQAAGSIRGGQRTDEDKSVVTSANHSVTEESANRVGGTSADRNVDLSRYRHLLSGEELPTMTQLMSGERAEDSQSQTPRLLGEADSSDESSLRQGSSSEESTSTQDGKKSEKTGQNDPSREKSVSGEELSKEESAEVQKLQARDREVRAHEQAHVAAGGQYIRGGITYDYQRGPDGKSYAVGGHVDIDVSEEKTPEATINKMRQVKRAALAPAEPSGADRAVAAAASSKEQKARSEIVETRQEEAVERRQEASKDQGAQSSRSDGVERSASQETSSSDRPEAQQSSTTEIPVTPAPEPPKVDGPRTPEMMDLARESRMRIKRGDYWLA